MKGIVCIIIMAFMVSSCEQIFESSDYEIYVPDNYKGQTIRNIAQIMDGDSIGEPIKIIAISDTFLEYGDLGDAVNKINNMQNVDFVIHAGDMTNKGLSMEYELFCNNIDDLKYPYLTAIGNQDHLSNGELFYSKIFNFHNYAFHYKGVKFIFFDATPRKSGKRPDMDWFARQMNGKYMPKFIVSHLSPCDRQYSYDGAKKYVDLLNSTNTLLSLHGSTHNSHINNNFKIETNLLELSCIKDRKLCVITINADMLLQYELVEF